MAEQFRTSLKQVQGLGAAKHGVQHFISQRFTALLLLFVIPWFALSIFTSLKPGFSNAIEWVSNPFNMVMLVIFIAVGFTHMRLGVQVVIEDYIAKPMSRLTLLIVNSVICYGLMISSIVAIITIVFQSGQA